MKKGKREKAKKTAKVLPSKAYPVGMETSRSNKNPQPKSRHRSNESSTERKQSTWSRIQQFR